MDIDETSAETFFGHWMHNETKPPDDVISICSTLDTVSCKASPRSFAESCGPTLRAASASTSPVPSEVPSLTRSVTTAASQASLPSAPGLESPYRLGCREEIVSEEPLQLTRQALNQSNLALLNHGPDIGRSVTMDRFLRDKSDYLWYRLSHGGGPTARAPAMVCEDPPEAAESMLSPNAPALFAESKRLIALVRKLHGTTETKTLRAEAELLVVRLLEQTSLPVKSSTSGYARQQQSEFSGPGQFGVNGTTATDWNAFKRLLTIAQLFSSDQTQTDVDTSASTPGQSSRQSYRCCFFFDCAVQRTQCQTICKSPSRIL